MIKASAPGKLVLCGEYAVLSGAPAVVLAIDRRAGVTLKPASRPLAEALGPPLEPATYSFDADGSILWHSSAAGDYRLFEAVMKTLGSEQPLECSDAFRVVLDTRAFYGDGRKLGLGSSAALTTALLAVLCQHFGREMKPNLAYCAHTHLQSGVGSGLDVGASLSGGLIRFLRLPDGPQVNSLSWPQGLGFVCVWTGRSAATAPRASRFLAWATSGGDVAEGLAAAARDSAEAWESGDAERILSEISNFAERLRDLDAGARLDIWDGGHGALARLAGDVGVVYKPSGAGGGDLGVAFATDKERLGRFRAQAILAGFVALDVAFDSSGCRIDE